jgi:hypothetical protein
MAEPEDYDARNRAHISINAFRDAAAYTFPVRNQERKPLREHYAAHAATLLDQLAVALGELPTPGADARLSVQGLKRGAIVEITTLPPAERSRTRATKVPSALEFPTQDVVVLRSERNDDRRRARSSHLSNAARPDWDNTIGWRSWPTACGRRPAMHRRYVHSIPASAQVIH